MANKFKYRNKSFSTKKELNTFLRENKTEIIAEKKALKYSDAVCLHPAKVSKVEKAANAEITKKLDASGVDAPSDVDVVNVVIIGNTANYIDSDLDALMTNAFKKSLQENQSKIRHLHDHIQDLTGKIGIPNKIYLQDFPLKDLGLTPNDPLNAETVQCVVMDSNVLSCYNKAIFNQYLQNDVDQHSVGMIYINISLCIDSEDEEDADYKKNWDKYYPQIINKDEADKYGYFFAVTEAKLLEISAVLWGANKITPTVTTNPITSEEPADKNATPKTDKSTEPAAATPTRKRVFIN